MIVKHYEHVYTFKMTFLRISHQVRYIFEENGRLVAYQDSEKLLEGGPGPGGRRGTKGKLGVCWRDPQPGSSLSLDMSGGPKRSVWGLQAGGTASRTHFQLACCWQRNNMAGTASGSSHSSHSPGSLAEFKRRC